MRTVTALVRSCHPGPTLAVTTLAVLLALGPLDTIHTLLVGLAVLTGQLSIGFSNDWLDADRDRQVDRTDKPVARGDIAATTVRTAAWIAVAATALASATLGPAAGGVHLLLVASGWSYNLGLKRTAWSVVPFIVSFGLLPAVVTLTAPQPALPAPWALLTGALFGVAVHVTNVLPDLDDDARTAVVGLPHRLGRTVSGLVAFTSLGLAALTVLLGPLDGGTPTTPALIGLLACITIVVWGIVLVLTRPPGRLLFQLIITAALLTTAQLVVSGTLIA